MNTNERERELVCLHPLGFKDSTKNTRFVFPQNGKEFLHTCLSLQKEDSRLCDVNDAYFKEEDEDKEERTRVVGEYSFSMMDFAFLVAKSRRLLRVSSSSSFDDAQRIFVFWSRHLSSASASQCLCIRRHCVSLSSTKGRQRRADEKDDDDTHGQQKRRFSVTTASSSSSAEKKTFARTIGGDVWTTLNGRKRHSTTSQSHQKEEEEDKDKEEEKLHLSEKCERQLRSIFAKEEEEEEKKKTALRVGVDGGGCAGFQYTFSLVDFEKDVDAANDRVFRGALYPEEVKVVCDEVSFAYLKGSTVDYSEEMIRSAFEVVKNPNAEQKCGCGVSFEAKF